MRLDFFHFNFISESLCGKFSTVIHSGEAMFGTRKRNRISSK